MIAPGFGRFGWIVVFILLSPFVAFAEDYELHLRRPVAIYDRPAFDAKIIGRGRAGQKLQAIGRRRGYYEVRFLFRGRLRRGYVAQGEAGNSLLRPVHRGLTVRSAVGLSAIYSQQYQESRELETAPGNRYSITEFKGSSTFFRLFYDAPLEHSWGVRGALVFRHTKMTGDAHLVETSTTSKFELQQNFVGAEALLKKYVWRERLWLGGGLEVSRGTRVSIKTLAGPPLDDRGIEKPFFAVLSLGGGYDFRWGRRFIIPEVRYGAVVTTDPFIHVAEALLNIAYGI